MNIRRYLAYAAITLLAVGCATATKDIKVSTETNPKVDLEGYKSYAWAGWAVIVNDPQGNWEPAQFDADAEIRWLINSALRKKGLVEVDEAPDLLVGYAAGVDMTALESVRNPETKALIAKEVPKGALVVALVDARTGSLVWLGEAMGEVQEQPPVELARERLDYAVNKMFTKMRR